MILSWKGGISMRESVIRCVEECGVSIDSDGTIVDLDSFKFISLIITLEDEFDIEFPDEYLNAENMETVDSICDILSHILLEFS